MLVGAMKAEKILLATPLLQYYLQLGLKVTEIFQVVEYTGIQVFEDFKNKIADARRQQGNTMMANTMKLIG